MALFMIGLGLCRKDDISVRGLQLIKRSKAVYLENYTSAMGVSPEELEGFYGKKIILADRELVESEEKILRSASASDTSFLVIGDVFSATTHISLYNSARQRGIDCQVVHNASILTAVGVTGLELYKFGRTVSIPFNNTEILTPLDIFRTNLASDMHTLFLLDLDPWEQRFMTVPEAIEYLLRNGVSGSKLAAGCAALGSENAIIRYGSLESINKLVWDINPQCLIIPAKLHFVEEETLSQYKII